MLLALPVFQVCCYGQEYVFDYNARCQRAYEAYLSLKISEGDDLMRKEYAANPKNLMCTYISDYGDFLTLLFQGSKSELKRRQPYAEERLRILEHAADNDPWKNLARAGIHLHWAIVHGWYGDQFKAATTFRRSYLLLKQNNNKFPQFDLNNVFLGIEEAAAGAIPDDYKWLASIFGMKGDIRKGDERLTQFMNKHKQDNVPLRIEAFICQQYIRFYLLSQQESVWKKVNSNEFPAKDNLMNSFVRANIALNYRKADVALRTLKEASVLPGYDLIPTFDFEMGNALFLKLDPTCIAYYNQFTAANKSGIYTKDALMKISLAYYLNGNNAAANEVRLKIGKYGNANTDADKQAKRFHDEPNWPNQMLLQARLLTDGGYYQQALAKLSSLSPTILRNQSDILEYYYRAGKIYEETGDFKKAFQYYLLAIKEGTERKEQYAARAALQMGLVYEEHGQKQEAIKRFEQCLSMKNHDFQASIDQQAKAGLNRLGNAQ